MLLEFVQEGRSLWRPGVAAARPAAPECATAGGRRR
jgi:hypothetical protein